MTLPAGYSQYDPWIKIIKFHYLSMIKKSWSVTLRNKCFMVTLCRLLVKRTKLEVATTRKNTEVIYEPWRESKCVPTYSYFWRCGYSQAPWVQFVTTDELLSKGMKHFFKDRCYILSKPSFLMFTTFYHLHEMIIWYFSDK